METYNDTWKKVLAKKSAAHSDKVNAFGKSPTGWMVAALLILERVVSLAGWVALAMVPTSHVDLADAACLFVISYVIGRRAKFNDDAGMGQAGAGPKQHVGEILVHNAIIGEDIREIKNLLKNRTG